MKFLGLIPARYASTRFPGKPLADIGGKPMIQRVYEQVEGVLDDVYVATDDQRIYDAVKAFGGQVLMTSTTHRSGTDRCAEAMQRVKEPFDVVVNIQGDEPFIQPAQIETLKACFLTDGRDNGTEIATLCRVFRQEEGLEALFNPNSPKLIMNGAGEAVYFSRSVIPYLRAVPQEEWLARHAFYKHIGIYAYRKEVLQALAGLSASPLEQCESLEQLRWIENGYRIRVAVTDKENLAVDTPDDLKRILDSGLLDQAL